MSQSGILNRGVYPPGTVVETLTGNTGGAVSPSLGNNINLISANANLTIVGNLVANTLTFTASNSPVITYTNVDILNFTATPVMEYLSVDTSALAINIVLPTTGVAQGEQFIIKDRTGQANLRNISITVEGGALIDGAAIRLLILVNESVRVIFNGTNYEVY